MGKGVGRERKGLEVELKKGTCGMHWKHVRFSPDRNAWRDALYGKGWSEFGLGYRYVVYDCIVCTACDLRWRDVSGLHNRQQCYSKERLRVPMPVRHSAAPALAPARPRTWRARNVMLLLLTHA